MPKSPVYLWTGNGWGKTTSALGVALRQVGHGHKAVIIQFMKGWGDKLGEVKVMKKLRPEYQIFQFGRKEWVNLNNPSKKDRELAEKGLGFAEKVIRQKPDLLVLDEINLACAVKLIKTDDVIKLLDKAVLPTHVYLTGRRAPKKLINRADYVTELRMIKGPKKLIGEKGIDY